MAETVDSVTSLPTVRRYITQHNADGRSIHIESPPQKYFLSPGAGAYARSYSVASPAKLADNADTKAYLETDNPTSWNSPAIVTPGGTNLIVVDLVPGGQSLMHQTVSIDFSVVVLGEIEHELDSGEIVRLKPGDHIVQRGTKHLWRNASKTEPARFIASTISIEPFEVNGKVLEEVWDTGSS